MGDVVSVDQPTNGVLRYRVEHDGAVTLLAVDDACRRLLGLPDAAPADWPSIAQRVNDGKAFLRKLGGMRPGAPMREFVIQVETDARLRPVEVVAIAPLEPGSMPVWTACLRPVPTQATTLATTQYELLQRVIDALPHPVILKDSAGRYLVANVACQDFLGDLNPASLRGKTLADLPSFTPEQRELVESEMRETLQSTEMRAREVALTFPDGQRREVIYAARRIQLADMTEPGTLVSLVDISRTMEAKRQAEAAESQLRRLTESLPVAVYQYERDPSGVAHMTYAVHRGYELFGVDEKCSLADMRYVLESVLPEDRPILIQGLQEKSGDVRSRPYEFRVLDRRDGSIHWVLSESFPERLEDGTVVCSGYWADISDRKRMEAELLKAKEIAEAATHAKAMFLANMSHEIRTPMNAILGMAYLALQGELPPAERDYVRNIQTAARSLLGIVNDILDFSKMDGGHLRLKQVPMDLSEVVASVVSVAMVQANEKGLRLVSRVAPDIPHPLVGDPMRLGQVLTNLANNAIKFTDEGEVTLLVDLLADDAHECAVRFSVSDTGVGLLPEQQTGLFEAFSQVDGSTTRHHGGTGLGLSICKQLVGLMGGEIQMHSVYGEGSTFSFELRFARTEQPQTTAPDIEEVPDFGGRTVLLVDDNEFNRIVTREVLAIANLEAIAVESGPEAIEVLRNDVEGKIALILLDVQLPEMDGYEVARRVRSMPGLAEVPIIAMTAHALSEVREQCLQAGMDDYISKPVDPPLLYRLIASWLLADANDSSKD